MFLVSNLIALAIQLSGCGWGGAEFSAASYTQPTERSALTLAQVCYPGSKVKGRLCLNTTPAAAISDPALKYADPQRDPSFPKGADKRQYSPPVAFLDLPKFDQRSSLSDHFLLNDYMPLSKDRAPWGLFSSVVAVLIEDMRLAIGRPVYITSGFRSPGRNSTTPGAASWSRHLYGDAIDFVATGVTYADLAKYCLKGGAAFYQLYTDHIHCDWRTQPMDPAFFAGTQGPTGVVSALEGQFDKIRAVVSENVNIVRRLEINSVGQVSLALGAEFMPEDDGEVIHEWWVKQQDGTVTYHQGPQLPLSGLSGPVDITLLLGGSIEVHRHLELP